MKITIKNRTHCINVILAYGAHLNQDLEEYFFHDVGGYSQGADFNSLHDTTALRLKLPEGKSEFIYKSHKIKIDYRIESKVVGCGSGPEFLEVLSLICDDMGHNEYTNLYNDSSKWYSSGKSDSEIITFICTQGHWGRLS